VAVRDGESRVHSRFLFLMNGLGMRPGLGGRFSVMAFIIYYLYHLLFVVVIEFTLSHDWLSEAQF
jgi:hypothetical protein